MKVSKWTAAAVLAAAALAGAGAGCLDKVGDAIGGPAGHAIKGLGHLGNAAGMNEEQEDGLGQSVGISLTNTFRVSQDTTLIKYVNYVGLTVAMGSDDPNGKYVFAVLDAQQGPQPIINAWSAPGGYIFISRGVVDLCQDEAELAGVLAHEIAHVNHHDGLEEVKRAQGGAALGEFAQMDNRTAQYSGVLDQFVDLVIKQTHSQPQELAADAAAVQFLANAGYDPASYLRFLQRLGQVGGGGGQVMSSHPGVGQRIQAVAGALTKVKPGGQTLQPRFAAWVRRQPVGQPIPR
jgi:predicted Zn-dependent protease